MAANNKPTQKPAWIPDNTTNITDPGSKATNGWLTGDTAPSQGFNWFWNRVSQWINYQDGLDYFTNDYTISVTDSTEYNAAITEIAVLPKDLNGYTLVLTAEEKKPANFLDSDIPSTTATISAVKETP